MKSIIGISILGIVVVSGIVAGRLEKKSMTNEIIHLKAVIKVSDDSRETKESIIKKSAANKSNLKFVETNLRYLSYFPMIEVAIISKTAEKYKLTQLETDLLFAIRRVENSGCLRIDEFGKHVEGAANGMQFGAGDCYPDHAARRHAGNFEASLKLQSEWAAGTIVKRYRGKGIEVFAKQWCPPKDQQWIQLVSHWIRKFHKESEVSRLGGSHFFCTNFIS